MHGPPLDARQQQVLDGIEADQAPLLRKGSGGVYKRSMGGSSQQFSVRLSRGQAGPRTDPPDARPACRAEVREASHRLPLSGGCRRRRAFGCAQQAAGETARVVHRLHDSRVRDIAQHVERIERPAERLRYPEHDDVLSHRAGLAKQQLQEVRRAVVYVRHARQVEYNREARRIVESLCSPGQSAEQLLEVITYRRADGREIALDQLPLAGALSGAETVRAEEIALSVSDGRSVTTLINATPIHAEDGAVASVVVTMQDLAPLEELERQRAGFSTAARKLAPRDSFIGWTPQLREKNLPFVIDNPRFLILPWITIPNLGSHILSLVRRQLPDDWTERYNTTPVLIETFVETPRFTGALYKASGWTLVGTTKGRGRYDRHTRRDQPKKDIWLRPLRKDWRRTLNR